MKSTSKPSPAKPAGSGADPVGKKFGDFRILRTLGQGGMGQVFLAEQISLRRHVAIKVLRVDLATDPVLMQRFEVEAMNVAKLNHPNVVQVYLVGEHEGRSYVVFEYVEGKSLKDYLARQGRLDLPLVLSLMRQIGSALQSASELGIVHRDVKPANILLTRKGRAKVADFGLSRCSSDEAVDLTRDGTTVGTPLYMSPEQLEGKPVDFRSDVYSFGVTCYHMLAGRPPFEGDNALGIALKHVREQPDDLETVRPDVPAELAAIVGKMMAKKPGARYQSAREVLDDVARLRESLGGMTTSVAVGTRPDLDLESDDERPLVPLWKRPSVRWLAAALAAVVALVALTAGVGVVGLRWYAERNEGGARAVVPSGAEGAGDNARQRGEAPGKSREETLQEAVEKHLRGNLSDPAGVDACIELGVLYLDQKRLGEAETLFRRLDQQRAPSAEHFVGDLGLAIVESLQKKHRTSHARITSLFDPKKSDNRAQILNQYLTKHPDFARWASEADAENVRNGAAQSSMPSKLKRPTGKWPFKK